MSDKKRIAQQINRFLQMAVQSAKLPEGQALEVAELYPKWTYPKTYAADEIVGYGVKKEGGTQLYKVLQAHQSQEDWKPDTAPSLYQKIGFTEDGTAIWSQPLAVEDAYKLGDRVSHKGQLWKSTVDNNVWEPGVYGWEEVEDSFFIFDKK